MRRNQPAFVSLLAAPGKKMRPPTGFQPINSTCMFAGSAAVVCGELLAHRDLAAQLPDQMKNCLAKINADRVQFHGSLLRSLSHSTQAFQKRRTIPLLCQCFAVPELRGRYVEDWQRWAICWSLDGFQATSSCWSAALRPDR